MDFMTWFTHNVGPQTQEEAEAIYADFAALSEDDQALFDDLALLMACLDGNAFADAIEQYRREAYMALKANNRVEIFLERARQRKAS